MTEPVNLTDAQYRALVKWADGKAHNVFALGVRDDVAERLFKAGLIGVAGFLMRAITPAGRAALAAYEQRKARK